MKHPNTWHDGDDWKRMEAKLKFEEAGGTWLDHWGGASAGAKSVKCSVEEACYIMTMVPEIKGFTHNKRGRGLGGSVYFKKTTGGNWYDTDRPAPAPASTKHMEHDHYVKDY